jgi:NADPH:quinone reductase-like Zn-dependent oxidoreductase
VKAGVAFKIPDAIDDKEAASLGLGIATVVRSFTLSLLLHIERSLLAYCSPLINT